MQTYENHAQRTPFFLVLCGIFAIAFFWQCYVMYLEPSIGQTINVAVAGALAAVPFVLRTFSLRVQDRVIRLEMRLRLKEVLPSSMHADIHKLAPRHLVALRFASDAELPSLVSEVLANPEIAPKSIKQKIKNWQADYLRA